MAKDRLPWFPCYPEKLLGALAGMPPDAGYVYTVVLLRTYEVAGPCPDSAAVLARRTGLPERRVLKALDWLIDQRKLAPSDRGFVNPYAAEVLADVDAHRNSLSTAGKKGATTRWGKSKQKQRNDHGEANATEIPNDGYLHLHQHKQVDSENKKEPAPRKSAGASLPSDWAADHLDHAYAIKLGLSVAEAESCAEDMRLWARGNANRAVGRKADWRSTYHGWMRREAPKIIRQRGFNRGGSNGKTQGADDLRRTGFAGLAARARFGEPADRLAPEDLEPVNRR